MSKPLSLYEQATEEYRESTLDYLLTLREAFEKTGSTGGPRMTALKAELKRRMTPKTSNAGMGFVLIETYENEILAVRTFTEWDAPMAHETFETICAENNFLEEWDVSDGCGGTVRLAGDEDGTVQLLELLPE